MAWPWRLLAVVLFAIAMAPVVVFAKWLGRSIPDWVALVIAGMTIGAIVTVILGRLEAARYRRTTRLPPD